MEDVERKAYTVRGAARRMGIGTWLLYEMLAQGEIPHFRFRNRAIRIDSGDLEEWLAAHRVSGPTRPAAREKADAPRDTPAKRGRGAGRSHSARRS